MATKAKATRSRTAQGTAKRRIRKIFGDIHEVVDMPNLIEVQRDPGKPATRIKKVVFGLPPGVEIDVKELVQIMTGGMMPEGADTVVMQEQVERDGDTVRIGSGHRAGQNVRAAGEDLATGQPVFSAGRQLTAADIGVLASLGLGETRVWRRLKVAFFSTGDELASAGTPLVRGQIYDSNRYTLFSLLSEAGAEIVVALVHVGFEDDLSLYRHGVADLILTGRGIDGGGFAS